MAAGDALPPATGTTPGVVILGEGVPKNNPPGVLALRSECGVFHVAEDGDDIAGDGSLTNPFKTLTKAFAVITANPKPGGYEVVLPGCPWEENVGIPPPGTRLRGHGQRSYLTNIGGTPLTWQEGGTDAGLITLEDLAISANLTGRDGGDFNVDVNHAWVYGSFARLGGVKFDSVAAYPALSNIHSLEVRNTRTRGASLQFTYSPSAGGNGLGPTGHLVDGGSWGSIVYNSEDASNELVIVGATMITARADGAAVVRVRASRVTGNLVSNDGGSLIEYDQMVHRGTPSYLGSGRFSLSEILQTESYVPGFIDSNVTVCVPRHPAGTIFDRVFVNFSRAGFGYEYVSNTDSDVVIRIIPPPGPVPAFTATYLIRPRLFMFVYHDVGYNLRLRFMLRMGGAPLTAQPAFVRIQRRSNGEWWDGAAWVPAVASIPMIEESALLLPGSYIYDFNQAAAGGGSDEYHCYFFNNAAAPLNVVDEETHVFKPGGGGGSGSVGNERRIQPVIGEKNGVLELVFWIEEGGRRVIDYDSVTAVIVDGASSIVATLGTDGTDTVDGLFQFVTPVAPIQRGKSYVVRVTATRGLQVDSFNAGFVRY